MIPGARWLGVIAIATCAGACSDGRVAGCLAGESRACTGVGGCSGGQVCLPDGQGFGPCDCGPIDSGTPAHDSGTDAGRVSPDAGRDAGADAGSIDAGSCGFPTDSFGTSVGSHFRPLVLSRCNGADFALYGAAEGYCDASFTVVLIVTGWCVPCRTMASDLEARVVDVYRDRGVRVVQVLLQNDEYLAPDGAFCSGWATEYGLSCPVVNDPRQDTQIYFPGNAVPAYVIVDSTGTIRQRAYGATLTTDALVAELDVLLGP